MKKKIYKISVLVITILLVLVLQSQALAATADAVFGLQAYRKPDENGKQTSYKIGDGAESKMIWKVVKYENEGTTFTYDHTIYCLKAEQGFFTETTADGETDKYNTYEDFRNLDNITSPQFPVENYNEILWILDHAYVPTAESAKEDRDALLTAAFAYENELMQGHFSGTLENTEITDDDIDVAQQMALWYFTNPDDEHYHKDGNDTIADLPALYLNTKVNNVVGPNYTALENINSYRNADITAVYHYLVETAKANPNYVSSIGEAPISLDNMTEPFVQEEGDKYIVGPFKINKHNDNPYTLVAKFTDGEGNEITEYTILNGNKEEVTDATIASMVGQEFYIVIPNTRVEENEKITFSINGSSYSTTTLTYWIDSNGPTKSQPLVEITKQKNPIEGEITTEVPKKTSFDLALRKFISEVNGVVYNREPQVDTSKLNTTDELGRPITTAIYNHTKTPVSVKKGDTVTYTIRVYNEGEIDGYAQEVTDYIPKELEFINDEDNAEYGWRVQEGTNGRVITTDYLSKEKGESDSRDNLIKAFDGTTLSYQDIKVKCKVKEDITTREEITNIAQITEDANKDGEAVKDRDSTPNEEFVLPSDEELPNYKEEESNQEYVPGQEDDDDFEKVIVQEFDLALRKFISGVNGVTYIGREPQVDTSKLNTVDENGNPITTAIYNHTKKAINVEKGDIVTYTIRVYNEGDIDGFASKITDYLPPELEFLPEDELNKKYGWEVSEDGRTVTTEYLAKINGDENIIHHFGGDTLDYQDIQINCKVKEDAEYLKKITNLAQITEDSDANGDAISDRDSTPDGEFVLPSDEELPNYKEDQINQEYVPGQEDDDDFEKVTIVYFDLSLQKFITGVNDESITNREPHVNMDQIIKGEGTEATYTPTAEDKKNHPVEVEQNDTVIYTIRIYNQGNMAGYASQITDDVPDGLEFLPDHEINKQARWIMYKLADDTTDSEEPSDPTDPENPSNPEEPTNEEIDKIKAAYEEAKQKQQENQSKFLEELKQAMQRNFPESGFTITESGEEYIVAFLDGNSYRIDAEGNVSRIEAKTREARDEQEATDEIEGAEEITYGGKKYVRTDNPEEAVLIQTDYLSKEQGDLTGRDNLIRAFDPSKEVSEEEPYNPDYRDVQVAFKVTEPNTSDRVIINTAEISEDRDETNNPVEDIDSTPGNEEEGEDDIDKEYIRVKYFDLALKKWVSKAIVIENGKETVTETGHTGDEDPEPIVKVDLDRKNLSNVVVKFEYQIKITNEGEIAGYAKEITDYVPEGLVFVVEDNPEWYIRDGNPRKVATRQLENTLLEPGESATVSILLTWQNNPENVGVKINVAEISEDYNESNTPDIDSTPDNEKEGEDDIDDAPVMLAIALGKPMLYIGLGGIILMTIAGGIILIKKYVI